MAKWIQSFEEYAQKLLEKAKITGATVGLAENGEMSYFQGFGLTDNTDDAQPVTADTVFGIGSVTKMFTCVAIMQLQEAGKLSVHDPVIKYIPELRTPNEAFTREITIHHLMTHTAGFPAFDTLMGAMKRSMENDPESGSFSSGLEFDLEKMEAIDTKDQFVTYISGLDYELLGPPGTQFSYSNDSYALLGVIIERVSEILYEQFVKENILDPAGMTRSAFLLEDLPQDTQVATLFTRKSAADGGEVYRSPAWWDAPSMRAGGKLKSTIHDLLRFTEIFRTGGLVGEKRILSEESVSQMTLSHTPMNPHQGYGYGFMIASDCHGGTLIEHGGAVKGVSAQLFFIPERNLTGAVLMNVDGGPAADIMHGILNETNGKPANTAPFVYPDYEVSTELLTSLVGAYRSAEGAKVTVEIQENGLVVKIMGTSIPLRPVGEDSFVFKRGENDSFIRFVRDETGVSIRLFIGGRQLLKSSVVKEQTTV
ncbi:serine hydrolase [Brevibacillus sp. NRS-1366]|uniref:serine hydrolase n=1 Tax=Brevibacillus sp. NRS-1366 TaxID=3233899 RepID=UPI003D2425C3